MRRVALAPVLKLLAKNAPVLRVGLRDLGDPEVSAAYEYGMPILYCDHEGRPLRAFQKGAYHDRA